MSAYYNEHNPHAAQWLRNLIAAGLIAPGEVDERDIRDVRADDLRGFRQCHFFAGIGGWSYALRLAGWPDDKAVWTGSCPCQPVSSASRGRSKRLECERHLWPVWRELIATARPRAVFGEQVAQAADWHAVVGNDMEAIGYAFASAYLPSVAVAKDHERFRFYYVGYPDRESEPSGTFDEEMDGLSQHRRFAGGVVRPDGIPSHMDLMRGFGNAIDPQLAASFIAAVPN